MSKPNLQDEWLRKAGNRMADHIDKAIIKHLEDGGDFEVFLIIPNEDTEENELARLSNFKPVKPTLSTK